MNPTLHNNRLGLGLKTILSDINRFDIVIIDTEDKYLIKRAIGLPGETVEYKQNTLYINNREVKDEYNFGHTEDFKVYLDRNQYFCMGDNRENSADSRVYGPFSKSDIKAVSLIGGN